MRAVTVTKLVDSDWNRKPAPAQMTSPVAMKAIEGTSESISPPIQMAITPTASGRRPKRATSRPDSGVTATPAR